MANCFAYFADSLTKINPNRLFDPKVQFNRDPPTYQQITNIIRTMKSSGTPCPLDRLSIRCFKQCPYLADLIYIWLYGTVSTE